MKKGSQISAGGVVYKTMLGGKLQVLLTFRKNKNIWCLPKGKLEKGESFEEAAKREILEETGMKGTLQNKIDDIQYSFLWPPDNTFYFKTVTFYLYEFSDESIDRQDAEVDEVKWLDINKALKIMVYPSERNIVKKARRIIIQKQTRDERNN